MADDPEVTREMPPGDNVGCANGCKAPFGVRCSVCNTHLHQRGDVVELIANSRIEPVENPDGE